MRGFISLLVVCRANYDKRAPGGGGTAYPRWWSRGRGRGGILAPQFQRR